jgi:delta14-sterol reductase
MQVPSLTLESLPSELGYGFAMCLGFIAVLFILSKIVPGRKLEGAPLRGSGGRITYTLNGFPIFLILVAAVAAGVGLKLFSIAPAIHHFWGLFIAANVFSFVMTGLLYVFGKSETPKQSGLVNRVRELFMGVELNPSWLGIDLKMFSYRPSLMGLFLLNVGHACVQYETYGTLSQSMIVYEALTFIYVFNYFQFEYGMLYTWDIMAEKFGWMLVWGDYAFVPFAYSVIGWYLVDKTAPLPVYALVGLPILFVIGLLLFRGSNEQKERFKRNPQAKIWGRTAETMGGRILVSGFWGIGRKLNYTGEICIYFSWAGLSGTKSIVPYILPIWLFCLLTHRAWRDDKACRAKYGELWEQYCRRARFRMIPFLY